VSAERKFSRPRVGAAESKANSGWVVEKETTRGKRRLEVLKKGRDPLLPAVEGRAPARSGLARPMKMEKQNFPGPGAENSRRDVQRRIAQERVPTVRVARLKKKEREAVGRIVAL
jgi:hypothetical protein